ncbi:hypothetical protein [Aedoeadaptatus coxii]|uniref:hypothetical protein n=1 Tax=Aedoeadaptatus coxii TaxID=755172 RepID=UPI002AD40F54|nr:hypothetical protein [Peptoniphilus coxii]
MEKTQKELCRMRIKVLQEAKEDLAKKINPLLDEITTDLYVMFDDEFNETIDAEALYLVDEPREF